MIEMSVSHTPVCQCSGCRKAAADYDQRHGRLIFFCNDLSTFHDPRVYASNSFDKSVLLICGECSERFRVDGLKEETLQQFECPECETSGPILV